MDQVRHGTREADQAPAAQAGPRPVVLATFSVRIDPSAERMAFDSALEVGARLIVANLIPRPGPARSASGPSCSGSRAGAR